MDLFSSFHKIYIMIKNQEDFEIILLVLETYKIDVATLKQAMNVYNKFPCFFYNLGSGSKYCSIFFGEEITLKNLDFKSYLFEDFIQEY